MYLLRFIISMKSSLAKKRAQANAQAIATSVSGRGASKGKPTPQPKPARKGILKRATGPAADAKPLRASDSFLGGDLMPASQEPTQRPGTASRSRPRPVRLVCGGHTIKCTLTYLLCVECAGAADCWSSSTWWRDYCGIARRSHAERWWQRCGLPTAFNNIRPATADHIHPTNGWRACAGWCKEGRRIHSATPQTTLSEGAATGACQWARPGSEWCCHTQPDDDERCGAVAAVAWRRVRWSGNEPSGGTWLCEGDERQRGRGTTIHPACWRGFGTAHAWPQRRHWRTSCSPCYTKMAATQ